MRLNRPSYDWHQIKGEYVEGIVQDGRAHWPSYQDLADRHGLHVDTVKARGATEKWMAARAAFQLRVEQERSAERFQELVTLGGEFRLTAARIARNGLTITAARLQELGLQAQQRTEQLRQGQPPTVPTPNADEVHTLARTATTWYDLGQKALGEVPTSRVIVGADDAIEIDLTTDPVSRDQRTVGILAILEEAGVLNGSSNGHGPGMVLDVVGRTPPEPGEATDSDHDEVHPEDPDG